jgi:hypothetical protein
MRLYKREKWATHILIHRQTHSDRREAHPSSRGSGLDLPVAAIGCTQDTSMQHMYACTDI